MENKNTSLIFDKKLIASDLKKFNKGKPKMPFPIIAAIFLLVFIAGITSGIILLCIGYQAGYMMIAVGAISLAWGVYFLLKKFGQYRADYARYIEGQLRGYAKNIHVLPVSPIYSIFLKADDEISELTLLHNDEVFVKCKYEDVKNYHIYYNLENEGKRRLPDKPIKGVKWYSFELELVSGDKYRVDFINTYAKFLVNGRTDFEQFVNTKSVNDLATIVDKILELNKKNK